MRFVRQTVLLVAVFSFWVAPYSARGPSATDVVARLVKVPEAQRQSVLEEGSALEVTEVC